MRARAWIILIGTVLVGKILDSALPWWVPIFSFACAVCYLAGESEGRWRATRNRE